MTRAKLCTLPVLLILLGTVSFCDSNAQKPNASPPPQANGYSLVFGDEFDALDLSRNTSGSHTWYEGVWFNHRHAPLSNIHVDSSELHLEWTHEQDAPDTSITTLSRDMQTVRAWGYGYFEARMKWIPVKGVWPAFWLIPVQDAKGLAVYDGTKESGEIDVYEGLGDHALTFYGTIHDSAHLRNSANRNNAFPLPVNVKFSEFHSCGLIGRRGK